MATGRKIEITSPNRAKFEALAKTPTEPKKPKEPAQEKEEEMETSETPTSEKD